MLMYDSVTLTEIPPTADAVAGYVDGIYTTWPELCKRFPKAHKLSIAVSVEGDAECLDVEPRDATNAQAPAWVRRQQARGVARPVVYTSLSNAKALLDVLEAAGIARSAVRLWTAHYTHTAHRCGPSCGFGLHTIADATQYTDIALARNLDCSLVSDTFFPVKPKPLTKARLRAWVLAKRAHGVTWAALKKTSTWKLWRRLGGK